MTGDDGLRAGRTVGRRRRRRFGLLAIAGLAAAAAALGISYTADTAVNTATATPLPTSRLVFTDGTGLPTGFTFRVSAVTDPSNANDHTIPTAATMTPVAGAAGTVGSKGDLAIVDARLSSTGNQGHETISIYVSNLKELQSAYSQFAFPIRIYLGTFDHETGFDLTQWNTGDLLAASADAYVTNTTPSVSFRVPTFGNNTLGNILAVQLGEDGPSDPGPTTGDGGSFYTVCTNTAATCSGAQLAPKFYISVQPSP